MCGEVCVFAESAENLTTTGFFSMKAIYLRKIGVKFNIRHYSQISGNHLFFELKAHVLQFVGGGFTLAALRQR